MKALLLAIFCCSSSAEKCWASSDGYASSTPLACDGTYMKPQMSGDSYLQSARGFIKSKTASIPVSTPRDHPLPVDASSFPIPGEAKIFVKESLSSNSLGENVSIGGNATILSQVLGTSCILEELLLKGLARIFGRLYLMDSSLFAILVLVAILICFGLSYGISLVADNDLSSREAVPPRVPQRTAATSRAVLIPKAKSSTSAAAQQPVLKSDSKTLVLRTVLDPATANPLLTSLPQHTALDTPPPRQLSIPPSSTSVSQSISGKPPHLCAGLVVPEGAECVLAMPLLESEGIPPRNKGLIDVRDLDGKTVVRCEIALPDWNTPDRQVILEMRTPDSAAQGHLIGRCIAESTSDGRRQVLILDANGELCAHVIPDPYRPCYVLSGVSCTPKVFSGNFDEHVVNVTNDVHEPLADTEPYQVKFDSSKTYLKLRILSSVDVSLVITGLFASIFLGLR